MPLAFLGALVLAELEVREPAEHKQRQLRAGREDVHAGGHGGLASLQHATDSMLAACTAVGSRQGRMNFDDDFSLVEMVFA